MARDDEPQIRSASSSARLISGLGLLGVVRMTMKMSETDATEPSELPGIVLLVSILALLLVLVLLFA